jgi:ribosomal protein S18 acetylase RimI-like enzyme
MFKQINEIDILTMSFKQMFGGIGLEIKKLRACDAEDLQAFLVLFDDFFLLCDGEKGSAKEILKACPPSKDYVQDKLVLGVSEHQVLIGLIDLIQDYPEKGTWTIGYLLIHPRRRSSGLGRRLIEMLAAVLFERGATKMRSLVQEQNPRALKFWQHCGFDIARKTQTTSGTFKSNVFVLEVELHTFVGGAKT